MVTGPPRQEISEFVSFLEMENYPIYLTVSLFVSLFIRWIGAASSCILWLHIYDLLRASR